MKYSFLKEEEQLTLLLARVTFKEEEKKNIEYLITKKQLNWEYLLTICIKNKLLGLFWSNLVKLGLERNIPSRHRQLIHYYFLGVKERTKSYLEEAHKIGQLLSEHGIKYAFLKGTYFVPNMYKTFGSRNMNDIDILIKHSDSKKIASLMKELGYIQGEQNGETGKIEKIDRKKEILWKHNMNNMFPFLKKSDNAYNNSYKIDFCFSFDLDLKKQDVENILDYSQMGILEPIDFFLHLCCHYYKEATNVIWIYNINDITLIKLCDIREYINFKMDDNLLKSAIEKANELGYSKAIYYTLYSLEFVYKDGYEKKLMDLLNINDKKFVNKFGSKDYGKSKEWNKTIWERIFSKDNKDELGEELPKYKMIT